MLIDSENRARLADFGFARVCIPHGLVGASNSSDAGGTLGYMAPELFHYLTSDDISAVPLPKQPVDVFALGTLIYEVMPQVVYTKSKHSINRQVLSGRQPFHDVDRRVTKLFASKWTKLERPEWAFPNHAVWDIVERCRAEKPNDRPKPAEVLECLTHASKDPPAVWPSPPTVSSASFLGSSSRPHPSSRVTLRSSSPKPPASESVIGGGTNKQEPSLTKWKTS